MTTTTLPLDQPRHALFTPQQVFGATLLGTELAGALLLSTTARRAGAPELAYDAWVRAVALLALRALAIYVMPALAMLLTVFAAVHYHRFAKKMLDRSLEEHREAGGRIESSLKAGGYGLAFMLGAVLLSLIVG